MQVASILLTLLRLPDGFHQGVIRSEPLAGREATTPSIIRKVHKVQRREEMPPNGGIVLPENVHV
jgi:hypothetical protein